MILGFRIRVFPAGANMGCGGSKIDDLALVTQCRERRDFLKAASEHRYALASAHVSYFRSLKDVGDALARFVDEELVYGVSPPPDSPVLTLPSDAGKKKKKKKKKKESSNDGALDHRSSSASGSGSGSGSHLVASHSNSHSQGEEEEEAEAASHHHLHISSGSGSDLELESSSSSGHIHIEESPDFHHPAAYYPPHDGWTFAYMKKSSPAIPSMIYEERQPSSVQWGNSSDLYSSYAQYGNGGFFGFPPMGSPPAPARLEAYGDNPVAGPPAEPPAPPSPNVSSWDFFNPFDTYDNAYGGYYSQLKYGNGPYGSMSSSPDSNEVRQREGIPELEDETEQEPTKEVHKKKKLSSSEEVTTTTSSGEGTSRSAPVQSSDHYRPVDKHDIESLGSTEEETKCSCADSIMSMSTEQESMEKKGGSVEIEEASAQDAESSKFSLGTFSAHGTRNLQEAVKEIKDEFETASGYGKEVAVMLEVGRVPYQPRNTILKVIFSRILCFIAPPILSTDPPSGRSERLASSTSKAAEAFSDGPGKATNPKLCNLSSTLEKLYVWEKKLYKEVKDEERLRILYEKECKRLKRLDARGADSNKIDATQASIKKLLTKINVCIRGIDAISCQIQKLRDEELHPQLSELINGWTRMWRSMLKCHQKQFQAIMESQIRTLRARTHFQRDSSFRATIELEMELLKWCSRFSDWVNTQKSYVESLNGWLMRCLLQEPEETSDGLAPFSPCRAGAPPVFIICNDWNQAMERIAETRVASAMHDFATNLHQLWEKQDEEQNQRHKAEYVSKDLEKQLKALRMERARMDQSHVSIVPSGTGVSKLDDLRVDLDLMKKKLEEEKVRHKQAVKLVNSAASNSIQAGLVPIFEALANFTFEALKAHEQVRIPNAGEARRR